MCERQIKGQAPLKTQGTPREDVLWGAFQSDVYVLQLVIIGR